MHVQSTIQLLLNLKKYAKEYPQFELNRELKRQLYETHEINKQYENHIDSLTRELAEATRNVLRLEGDVIELDSQWRTCMHMLSVCQDILDEFKKEQEKKDNKNIIE